MDDSLSAAGLGSGVTAPGKMDAKLGLALLFFFCTSSPTTSKFLYVYPIKSRSFLLAAAFALCFFAKASSSSNCSKFCVSSSPFTSG